MRFTLTAAIGMTTTVLLCPAMLAEADRSLSAPPSEAPDLTIGLHVYDYAQVESKEMARAESEASRVLERVGIKTAWLSCSASGIEPQNTQACPSVDGRVPALALRILPRAMAERMGRADGPLGFAQLADDGGPGFVANVFYHRVESLAVDLACSPAVILGYVLAHEIGHLLLGTNSHSPYGIMRSHWTEKDLLSASAGRFGFLPQQSVKMRADLRKRITAAASAAPAGNRSVQGKTGPDPTVTVWVYNYAHVSKRDLLEGEKVTAEVFERAGITPEWVDCPISGAEVSSHPICQERMRPQELALVILPSFSGMHFDAGHTLGFSQVFLNGTLGHYAYVSYERVEAAAGRGPALAYQILGYVAAHELGHVLLASSAHSSSGIMRARLEEGDFGDVAQEGFTFTPQQAQRIRANAAARIQARKSLSGS
ncbi:MAG TPA: hypothetical protein VG204_07060 [Terriglobia bacterium]|nr:hypothetical protein [Terriglobia bacterium]